MQQRVFGPVRGYFIATVSLPMGDLGHSFAGEFKIYDHLPTGFFDEGELLRGQCPESPVRERALEQVEDMAFAAVQALPERAWVPDAPPRLGALIYASLAREGLRPEEIAQLLRGARARNAEHGITGMLLLYDGRFMQYIEGPDPQLELIYRIIRKDPLHHGLIELMRVDIRQRVFDGWSMAFDAPDAAGWLGPEAKPLLQPMDPAQGARAMLAAFLARHRGPHG
jgi:hypothetical protein